MLPLNKKIIVLHAVAKAIGEGYKIEKGFFLDRNSKKCCPIGALTLDVPLVPNDKGIPDRDIIGEAAAMLNCSHADVWAIVNGFDNVGHIEGQKAYYNFGAALREILL